MNFQYLSEFDCTLVLDDVPVLAEVVHSHVAASFVLGALQIGLK